MKQELSAILERGANDGWGLGLSRDQIDRFVQFAEILVDWNSNRMNLTRLTTPRDIAVKHFLDSLAVLVAMTPPDGARLIDVGTGPGLPGLALKIVRPDLRVTLLDSTAKKLQFCRFVADSLGLTEVDIVHGRAEEIGRAPNHAHAYDLVTARAVAPLSKLLPWCAPFVRPGGCIIALKGSGVESELPEALPVAKRLKLRIASPMSITLPEADEETIRQIIVATRFAA